MHLRSHRLAAEDLHSMDGRRCRSDDVRLVSLGYCQTPERMARTALGEDCLPRKWKLGCSERSIDPAGRISYLLPVEGGKTMSQGKKWLLVILIVISHIMGVTAAELKHSYSAIDHANANWLGAISFGIFVLFVAIIWRNKN